MSEALACIGMVASSSFASEVLAWIWSKNRGWLGYFVSTVGVWAGISALPLFTPGGRPGFPIDLEQLLANFVYLAPFAILPVLFLVPFVIKGVSARKVVIASSVTSLVALPLSFCSGIVASCSVPGDCL